MHEWKVHWNLQERRSGRGGGYALSKRKELAKRNKQANRSRERNVSYYCVEKTKKFPKKEVKNPSGRGKSQDRSQRAHKKLPGDFLEGRPKSEVRK